MSIKYELNNQKKTLSNYYEELEQKNLYNDITKMTIYQKIINGKISKCSKLKKIKLVKIQMYNGIDKNAFIELLNSNIETLQISDCYINISIIELKQYSNLHTININNCNLQSLQFLQSSFHLFNKLTKLDVSHNLLTHIPKNLYLCNSLNYINISNNHIYYIPEDFKNCKSLDYLDLSNNQISYINYIPNTVVILDLSFNSLKLDEIRIDSNYYSNLKKLNINGCILINDLYIMNNVIEEIYIMETLIDNIHFDLSTIDLYKNLNIFVYKYHSKNKVIELNKEKFKKDLDTIYKSNIQNNNSIDYKFIVE